MDKVECDCKDWKINLTKINSALVMAQLHGEGISVKVANYCLYCGKNLKAMQNKRRKTNETRC